MEERQTNYTIMEGYCLPSNGKIYSKAINPNVELRSMTARDEMKRLNPSSTQFKTLADIIEGCMLEKPAIHVYDMALGDYEYLLHKLRIVTYGDTYKMVIQCPFCGSKTDVTAHLEDLKVKEFNSEEWEKHTTFTLPKKGDTVTIKFQTPRMLDEAEGKAKEFKRRFKDADIDFGTLVLMTQIIDTVNGEKLSESSLEEYIKNLPAMDLMIIQNHLDALNACVGLDNSLTVTCGECGEDVQTYFRFGPEFFRPTLF